MTGQALPVLFIRKANKSHCVKVVKKLCCYRRRKKNLKGLEHSEEWIRESRNLSVKSHRSASKHNLSFASHGYLTK